MLENLEEFLTFNRFFSTVKTSNMKKISIAKKTSFINQTFFTSQKKYK